MKRLRMRFLEVFVLSFPIEGQTSCHQWLSAPKGVGDSDLRSAMTVKTTEI